MVKTILRVTPHKRPTIQEILEQPFFKMDEKNEQNEELTTKSTTNTEDLKNSNPSFQYLHESCNSKKMSEIQKILDK